MDEVKIPEIYDIKRLGWLSGLAMVFVAYNAILNRSVEFWYLPWNLFLAWVPVGLALITVRPALPRRGRALALTLWLVFLPNAFYILTDIIHIGDATRFSQTYDVLTICLTIVAGYLAGLIALRIIDRAYIMPSLSSARRKATIIIIALLCGVAIYIGRILRWNSWDIVANPLSLVADFAGIFTLPRSTTEFVLIVMTYSIVILASYYLAYSKKR